ncbi:hypothetical protein, partial [Hallella bergensis]|uniref:hypothetical protein n=1 Tax=Hallella bergensis TaxID=242750 RepID=UPI0023EF76F9
MKRSNKSLLNFRLFSTGSPLVRQFARFQAVSVSPCLSEHCIFSLLATHQYSSSRRAIRLDWL